MIDIVHDIAGSYRELVEANSYPGNVVSLKKYIKNNTLDIPFQAATLLFVYMLLDSEVTFCVVGKEAEQASEFISKLTYAKRASLEEADYIFVLSTALDIEKIQAIKSSKAGTLVDPHNSATIICEAESVLSGETMTIVGPGIENEAQISMDFAAGWQKERVEKNLEFPMGIEMYFIDEKSKLLALPRTTIVKSEEN